MEERTGGALPVTFGSASLLDRGDLERARDVLVAAVDAGAARLDVAPMYGNGALEQVVLELADDRGVPVTTKVGIEPRPAAPAWRRAAARAVRSMPGPARSAVRRAAGASEDDPSRPSGRFASEAVRASLERSLRRSRGRLNRVLLHEVHPSDVTDELLGLLEDHRDAGDVAEFGCATRNRMTGDVLARAVGVLTVAHVSTAPFGEPMPATPPSVRLVGHGAFGAGGADLRRTAALLARPGAAADAWRAASAGTPWEGDDGLVRALLARARDRRVDELLVATTRPERVAPLVEAAGASDRLDGSALEALERVLDRTHTDHGGGTGRVRRPADQH